MSKIVIGKAGGHNVAIDLDVLIATRLLVQANSGGGKSFALRRILEQAFGKIQCIVIDPAGEFSTLREKLDFVLAGEGGETPADVRSAALLATRLLELRVNAVCDLYSVKPSERHTWVKRFFSSVMNAPKKLWHPVLFVVDEAHKFMPEKGEGDSEAKDEMLSLCSDGRKYGFCAVLATQRLAKLDKSGAAELLNVLIGPTFIDVDLERAHKALGIINADKKNFNDQMKTVDPGNFWAFGRAISKERILVKIGGVETTHPEAGVTKYAATPPPAPDKIKAMLPKLADLPKAAEEQARTVAEFKSEIRSLKAQLRAQPQPKIQTQQVTVADPRAIERAVREAVRIYKEPLIGIHASEKALRANGARLAKDLLAMAQAASRAFGGKSPELPQIKLSNIPKFIPSGPATAAAPRPAAQGSSILPARSYHADPAALDGLSRSRAAILKAIAEFEAIGRPQISKSWIAARSGASYTSSAFGNNLGFLRSGGYIVYPAPDQAMLTEKGREAIGAVDPPANSDEMLHSCLALLTSSQQLILKALYEAHPNPVRKDELAALVRASASSSAYGNNLGALRSAGMIDYPSPGMAKCADWLFID